jgi:hypothetical protein
MRYSTLLGGDYSVMPVDPHAILRDHQQRQAGQAMLDQVGENLINSLEVITQAIL